MKKYTLGASLLLSIIGNAYAESTTVSPTNVRVPVESHLVPTMITRQDISQNMPNTIIFPENESKVAPGLASILAWNAKYIQAFPTAKIKIVGHSTDYNNNIKDEVLAMQRAENVRSILFVMGVPYENTDTVSDGNRDPAYTSESEKRDARNNRVDIFYTFNAPKGYHVEKVPVVRVDTYEQTVIPMPIN